MTGRAWGRAGVWAVIGFGAAGVGCSASMQKFDIDVALADAQAQGRTTVDIVALGDPGVLEEKDMSLYFTDGDRLRESYLSTDRVWTVELTPENPTAHLDDKDPIWKTWGDAGYLFIMADLLDGGRGGVETRRVKRSRSSECWDARKIDVTVSGGGISLNPDVAPDAACR